MTMKNYYFLLSTEANSSGSAMDFSAIICDRNGLIQSCAAVLMKEQFQLEDTASCLTAKEVKENDRQRSKYENFLLKGNRMMSTPNAVNRWVRNAFLEYKPLLTAYGLKRNEERCRKAGIDLSIFPQRFCLREAAIGNICQAKEYKKFAELNGLITSSERNERHIYQTDLSAISGFLSGKYEKEKHTAHEDAIHHALPVIRFILNKRNWKEKTRPYDDSLLVV